MSILAQSISLISAITIMAKSKYAEFFNIFKNASTNEGVTTTTTTYICKELDCSFKWVQKPGGPTNTLRTHLQGKHPDTFKVLEARDLVAKTAKGETAASKPAKSKEPKPKSAKANTSATSVKKETTLDNSAIDNNNLTENIQTQMEAILASSESIYLVLVIILFAVYFRRWCSV